VKLNTLIRFLHFLSNGEIKIKKENFEILQKTKKLSVLKRNVEKKAAVSRLLKSERVSKLKFLNNYQTYIQLCFIAYSMKLKYGISTFKNN
jgi:hypothetical protein